MTWRRLGRFVLQTLLLGVLWWLLTEGDPSSWMFGGPVILVAAGWGSGGGARRLVDGTPEPSLSGASEPQPLERFRPERLLVFAPLFVWKSLIGSLDVAWRTFHPRRPIDPTVLSFAFRLPAGSVARVFFTNCVSLLPGTLAMAWEPDTLRIHVLTSQAETLAELRQLERHVAQLFGHPWSEPAERATQ